MTEQKKVLLSAEVLGNLASGKQVEVTHVWGDDGQRTIVRVV